MESPEQIKARIENALPGVRLEIIPNGNPANPASLLVGKDHAVAVAAFLRDDPQLLLDYAANVTGVDWPDRILQEKSLVKRVFKGEEIEVEETLEKTVPGYLEVVYHLFSMEKKHGPVILRMRTENRQDKTHLPSLTPIYRGAEFQEREVYDLFGVIFDQHPDLRRLLMWDEFRDFPMRKDYQEPDDYEYEPTARGQLFEKARKHYKPEAPRG